MESSQHTHPAQTTQGTRLAAAIAAEKLDEFRNTVGPSCHHPAQLHQAHPVSKCKQMVTMDLEDVSTDDDNFAQAATSSEDESDSGDTDIMEISNIEVCSILIDFHRDINTTSQIADILLSKTVPETGNGKGTTALVFEGPVVWTEKRLKTGLNRTD